MSASWEDKQARYLELGLLAINAGALVVWIGLSFLTHALLPSRFLGHNQYVFDMLMSGVVTYIVVFYFTARYLPDLAIGPGFNRWPFSRLLPKHEPNPSPSHGRIVVWAGYFAILMFITIELIVILHHR